MFKLGIFGVCRPAPARRMQAHAAGHGCRCDMAGAGAAPLTDAGPMLARAGAGGGLVRLATLRAASAAHAAASPATLRGEKA